MTDEAGMNGDLLGAIMGTGGTVLVGVLGLLGRAMVQQQKNRIDELSAKLHAAEMGLTAKIDVNSGISQDITDRFKTLMDSYEARIKDLIAEVADLREQLRRVQHELKIRNDKCPKCPHSPELSSDADAPS